MSGWLPRLAFPPPSPNEVNLYALCENEEWEGILELFSDPEFRHRTARKKIYTFDEDDTTPFHYALWHKAPLNVIEAFLDVTTQSTPLHLLRRLNLLNIKDNFDQTPLHWAAMECDDISVIDLFIRSYPQALALRDVSGETPLKASMKHGLNRSNHAAIVELLKAKTEHFSDSRKFKSQIAKRAVRFCMLSRQRRLTEGCSTSSLAAPVEFFVKVVNYLEERGMTLLADDIMAYIAV
mmetsp:Transcript_22491/g.46898  ORF Transcript_22491/g.46898 Transcript_22491/m.46898 type:complete len:237 (-) Transcript_22491:33-743(-)